MVGYLICSGLVGLITVGCLLRKIDLVSIRLKDIADLADNLNKVLEFLGHLPQWIQFYNNLNANEGILRRKRDNLQARLNDLKMRVEEEEYKTGRQRKREVDNWLTSAETKCTDSTEVLSLLQRMPIETNSIQSISKFIRRAWLGSIVEGLIKEVDDLHRTGDFEKVLSRVRDKLELGAPSLVGDAAKESITRIMTWLESGVTKIGVHGSKGIGKTTVMMHIHNQLLRSYDCVYFITVLEDHKENQLQREIANAVGIDFQEEDEIKRAALLNRALQKRKFVLILDGLSKYFLEDKVGIPLGAETGKLIVTSRSPDVCRKTGCRNNIIAMEPLPENEALMLFKQKVELSFELGSPKEIVAREIVEQCRGVPRKIVDKARDLRGEDDINAWEKNLNDMLKDNT